MENKELIEKAYKELNEEGLLNGNKITEAGKLEAEDILKTDEKIGKLMLDFLLKKLENDFYETDFLDFCLKVLSLENILKKSNIDLIEKIREKIKNKNFLTK